MSRYLSPFFTEAEATTTSTGMGNRPDDEDFELMRIFAYGWLVPLRLMIGPIRINSWYRSPWVNEAVGGSRTSDHLKGTAADVVALDPSVSFERLFHACLFLNGVNPFDQVIVYPQPHHNSQRVHLGVELEPGKLNRGQVLVNTGGSYEEWSLYDGALKRRMSTLEAVTP